MLGKPYLPPEIVMPPADDAKKGHTLDDHVYGIDLAHTHDGYADHDHDFPDDGPLEQELPEGTHLLTAAASGAVSPSGLLAELAAATDQLHTAGFRLNSLHPGAVVVRADGAFVGFALLTLWLTSRIKPEN